MTDTTTVDAFFADRSLADGRYRRRPVPSPARAPLTFQLLGGLNVLRNGAAVDLGGRKQRAVLAVLALHADAPVPADRIIDHVWGDGAPARADVSLQAYVSKLRRLLEPGRPAAGGHAVLVTEPGGYRLVVKRADIDLARFDDLREAATVAQAGGDLATAARHYDAALALHGPLLPEMADEPWVAEAAAVVEAALADALDGAFEAKLALGRGRELIPGLETAVAAHPFQERLRGHLALALYRAGRQTDALRSLADARRALADEIGVEPGPQLRQLEADILAHAPRLAAPEAYPRAAVPSRSAPPTDPATSADRPPVDPSGPPAGGTPGGAIGLVGRADELDRLVDAARVAAGGDGGAVVISGEPGIGKTRLAEELVASVSTGQHVVVWARCQESASSAPYWGYTQIAEQVLAAGVVSDAARENISAVGGGVHTIDPGADRLALHASMVAALRSLERPLLIVVDDLQWADASSLRALEFVAGALSSVPVLLVATVRPVGPDASPPLVACLAELARQTGSQRLDLAGLSHAEVATWLRRRSDAAAADPVAGFVHERTGGNPFFVGELVELLARQDRLTDVSAARGASVPAAAVDVVRRRVGMLPADAQQLLATASVFGLTIDVDVLAEVAGMSVADALDTLDPPVEAGLLVEDRDGPGRLRFAHALVADALAAELSLARRARLHAAVVEAIESLRSANLDEHLPALVHHARAGVLAGTAPRAFDYSVRAACAAAGRVAYEAEAAYWDEARGLLDLARPGDRQARYDVLVALGRARRRADDLTGSQDALLDAIAVADAAEDTAAVRQAAAELTATTLWQTSPYGVVNTPLIGALERVLAGLDDAPTVERARLVGALADAVYYERDPSRSLGLSAEAVDIARRTGDPATLAQTLSQRFRALWRDTTCAEHREVADEMVDLAERGLVELGPAALAHLTRAAAAIRTADRPTFESDLARARILAERSRLPALLSQVGWAEASWLLALGRYDEASERAHDTHLVYRRTRGWEADDILASFELAIAHDHGAAIDARDDASAVVDGSFGASAREVMAWMLVEDGLLDQARALVGPVGSVPDVPPDWLWFEAMTAASHVRAGLGDRAASAVLYDRLSPFVGHLDLATGPFLGGVDLALAVLAAATGDTTSARRHAAAAVAVLDRVDARPSLARALHLQGRLLAASVDGTEREVARAAVDRSRALAQELRLAPVLAALDRFQDGSKPSSG